MKTKYAIAITTALLMVGCTADDEPAVLGHWESIGDWATHDPASPPITFKVLDECVVAADEQGDNHLVIAPTNYSVKQLDDDTFVINDGQRDHPFDQRYMIGEPITSLSTDFQYPNMDEIETCTEKIGTSSYIVILSGIAPAD